MKEIILTILRAILLAAVTSATPFVVSFIRAKSAEILERINNAKLKQYLGELSNAATTAVAAVSQTYVDSLKAEKAFTKEAQLEALEKAKNIALSIISPVALDFLEDVYEDIDEMLTAKIEENVRSQKYIAPIVAESITIE